MFVTISVILLSVIAVLVMVLAVAGVSSLAGCSFRKVFLRGLWALLLPPAVMLYGMFEREVYDVRNVGIVSGRIPAAFDGYRIVHISDIHLRSFRSRPASLKRAVGRINALHPDIVLFTGDLVTAVPSEMDSLETILSGLTARDGVYSVLGNHDYCIYHDWKSDSLRQAAVTEVVRRQENMGWRVLMNENVNLIRHSLSDASARPDTISIIGVENISNTTYFPSYGDLDKAMEGASGSFKILMTHDPTHWRKAVPEYRDIDLTLSGHTHAMQMSFFGWSPGSLLFSEYRGVYGMDEDGEVSHIGGKHVRQGTAGKDSLAGPSNLLYVNIGLGETAIPARIGTPPEITLFTLKSSGAGSLSGQGK